MEIHAIAAVGTLEQLKQTPGLYQRLWDIQGALETEFQALLLSETQPKENSHV
jgi:hypothetical protein